MKKSVVKVTPAGPDAGNRVTLDMKFSFDASSPDAQKVWRGLVLMLQELLTTKELHEFARQLNRERDKLAKKPPNCLKCKGTGKVDRGNGSTKACDCAAGIAERARRAGLARHVGRKMRKEPPCPPAA